VAMYYNDHAPPHFHVVYAGMEAIISIEAGDLIAGDLSVRALGLVREWLALHKEDLRDNWTRARNRQPLVPIEPLS
jgi:hypothetical protein